MDWMTYVETKESSGTGSVVKEYSDGLVVEKKWMTEEELKDYSEPIVGFYKERTYGNRLEDFKHIELSIDKKGRLCVVLN